ncbi:MAG: hypothetical protein OHK0022_05140 [Roseiflexaceae bacterium]
MSTADDPKATYCPSCGAPVTMGETMGTCNFCGTVVERQRDRNSRVSVSQTTIRILRSSQTSTQTSTRSGNRASGCTAFLFVAVLVIGVAAVIGGPALFLRIGSELGLVSRGDTGGIGGIGGGTGSTEPEDSNPLQDIFTPPVRLNISDFLAIIPRDAPADDLLAYLNSSDDLAQLALVDGTTRRVRWQTPALTKDARQGRVLVNAGTIYVTDGETLRALRLADGTLVWQTSLVAEPASPCAECLRVIGDRVVVLQKDGSLQGFNTSNGALAWSKRFKNTPRRLPVAGDKLVTVAPLEQGADNAVIELLDPATGQVARTIAPSCPSPDGSIAPRFYDASPVLVSPDGNSLFVVFTIFDACIQRWDVDKDDLVWQTYLDSEAAPSSWDEDNYHLTRDTIFVANDGVLSALDTASGAVKLLVQDEEQNLRVVAATDSTVILKTAPDWDSRKQALWGIDRANGERRWQFALEAEEYRPDTLFGDWEARLRPQGLALIQVPKESKQIWFDLLNPDTGVSAGRQSTPLSESAMVSWDAHWSDRISWWQIGSSVYAIDLTTGKVAYKLG